MNKKKSKKVKAFLANFLQIGYLGKMSLAQVSILLSVLHRASGLNNINKYVSFNSAAQVSWLPRVGRLAGFFP